MHHAPLVAGPWQESTDGVHQSGAPVAGHQAHAGKPTRDERGDEAVPTRRILLHALRHADHLPVPVRPDADRDQYAHVLHGATPRTLVPHAIHEHIRVGLGQRAFTPGVDVPVDLPELVRQGLRRHPLAPQGLADVVDATRGDAGQVHVDERLLDRFLPASVPFDHRRLEQGALQLRHPHCHFPGLDGQIAFVMAGTIRLPAIGTLVAGRAGDLVGLKRPASGPRISVTFSDTMRSN
ncbi:hypothetical protein BMIN_1245 [Bifidobacterium minimum]|uniref:Uncharacterized protein n=1 Tax=Bifidobacterium minimum TaxID=1693 RepID=A0A087BSI3_9BIFI|nr:hypothetical protein BMIN_1245 [Bifidobacterium minimum]